MFFLDLVVFLFGTHFMNVIAENPFFSFIYFYKACIIYFLIFLYNFTSHVMRFQMKPNHIASNFSDQRQCMMVQDKFSTIICISIEMLHFYIFIRFLTFLF